ncbi:MAG: DHA2 family efflux MFS transporter permease subunit [Thermoleophilia bacterium]|nr:DHA2 family efflux MFS transporter permease subunit [Thermoleophilia bacterium]GIK77804.1 MAG: MFS transporter [Actinomycetes bacterium]
MGGAATAESGGGAIERERDAIQPGTVMALAAMGLGVFVIANDFTALNVALPAIEGDLNADVGSVQWVINAYALVFGMAIVSGGRLADMFGRRRVFFIGTVLFATFSLLGAVAPDLGVLIGARVGMGVGGALMWPAILGMTFAALPESKAGLAGGLILGVAGIGNAVGPLLGGALTEALNWRWIFVLNVPIAAFAMFATWRNVHQEQEPAEERIDYAGMATLSAGLVLLLLALDQAVDWGWTDPRVLAMLVLAVVLVAAFAAIERRAGDRALIPPDVIENRRFRAACLTVLLLSAVFFSCLLYVPQFFEKILGYSTVEAGLGMLPMLAVFALTSFIAGPLYNRAGMRVVVCSGTALIAVGMVLFALLVGPGARFADVAPGLLALGVGCGLFYPSITTAAVTALDAARSSLAGGIVYMFQIAGGAVGLGVATAIFTSASENRLGDLVASETGIKLTGHEQSVLHGTLAGTDAAAAALAELPGKAVAAIDRIVADSFAHGVQVAFTVIAVVAVAGFLVSVLDLARTPDPDDASG